MKVTTFLILAGMIYLAPHMSRTVGIIMGCGFMILAAILGLQGY